jgi:hypothetical protein
LHVLGGQELQVAVDHVEELEAERKIRAGVVKAPKCAAGPCRSAGAGFEQAFRHGDGIADKRGHHETGRCVEVKNGGANPGPGRLARRLFLIGAVDIFLGSLAGEAQAIGLAAGIDAKDQIGQTAEPGDASRRGIKSREERNCGERFGGPGFPVFTHQAFSRSIFGSYKQRGPRSA